MIDSQGREVSATGVMVRCLMRSGLSQEAAEAKWHELSTRVDTEEPTLEGKELGNAFDYDPDDVDAQALLLRTGLRAVGLRPVHDDMTFSSYIPATTEQKAALALCRNSAKTIGELPGLVLVGKTGTGKTHLVVSLLRSLLETEQERQHGGLSMRRSAEAYMFTSVLELLHGVRSSYRGDVTNPTERAMEARVLVLDDLGRENVTDWTFDELMLVIQRRYDELKPTFITANMRTADALHTRYGDTFVSRFMDEKIYELVPVDGPDHRMETTKEKA